MTSSRDIVKQCLRFESPKRIPQQLWLLPWAKNKYPEESKEIQNLYPDDLVQCPAYYNTPPGIKGGKYQKGIYVDEWGCSFQNQEEGLMGIVPKALISEWTDLPKLKPPQAFLDLDVDSINRFCRNTDQFVYAGSIIRPFERFQFIRTMEQSFYDVMLEEEGYLQLLKILHEHYLKEVEAWARTDIDALFLMDDWGTQNGLMVPPHVFLKHFKPMYRQYCEIAHHYGKFVCMHSDGQITNLIEDLIEVGVDALNCQVFCMNINDLSNKYAGRITFWGEIDRQHLLSEGTKQEVEAAAQMLYRELWRNGGLIGQCEFGPGARPENIKKVFETWKNIQL